MCQDQLLSFRILERIQLSWACVAFQWISLGLTCPLPDGNRTTKNEYAMKRFKVGDPKDGIGFGALREVRFLQELVHPNIVKVSPPLSFSSFDLNNELSCGRLPEEILESFSCI